MKKIIILIEHWQNTDSYMCLLILIFNLNNLWGRCYYWHFQNEELESTKRSNDFSSITQYEEPKLKLGCEPG